MATNLEEHRAAARRQRSERRVPRDRRNKILDFHSNEPRLTARRSGADRRHRFERRCIT